MAVVNVCKGALDTQVSDVVMCWDAWIFRTFRHLGPNRKGVAAAHPFSPHQNLASSCCSSILMVWTDFWG